MDDSATSYMLPFLSRVEVQNIFPIARVATLNISFLKGRDPAISTVSSHSLCSLIDRYWNRTPTCSYNLSNLRTPQEIQEYLFFFLSKVQ